MTHSEVPSFWNFLDLLLFFLCYVKINGHMVGQNKTFDDGTLHYIFSDVL